MSWPRDFVAAPTKSFPLLRLSSGPYRCRFCAVEMWSFYNVSDYMDTTFFLLSLMFPRKPHISIRIALCPTKQHRQGEKCAVKCFFFNGNNRKKRQKKRASVCKKIREWTFYWREEKKNHCRPAFCCVWSSKASTEYCMHIKDPNRHPSQLIASLWNHDIHRHAADDSFPIDWLSTGRLLRPQARCRSHEIAQLIR